MKISIIIPMYSVEKYIEKCIISTQNQNLSCDNYEVIVVNDGSPDNSLQIAEKIASNAPNVKIITRKNGGLSAARNTGIDNAQGEYLFFLDSDDWIAEDCLQLIYNKLNQENPDVLCICAANVFNDKTERRFSYNDTTPKNGKKAFRWDMTPCAPFNIIRRKYLIKNKFRFYEGILHEDSELIPRLLYQANKVSFINEVIYYVYQSPNSITRTANPKRSFDLVNVVCKSLYNFSNTLPPYDDKLVFYRMISLYLNNALFIIQNCSKEDQYKFTKIVSEKLYFKKCLIKSMMPKYFLEGVLFYILPNKPISVYKLLRK